MYYKINNGLSAKILALTTFEVMETSFPVICNSCKNTFDLELVFIYKFKFLCRKQVVYSSLIAGGYLFPRPSSYVFVLTTGRKTKSVWQRLPPSKQGHNLDKQNSFNGPVFSGFIAGPKHGGISESISEAITLAL